MPINEYGFDVDANGNLVHTATGDYQRTPGAIATNAHTGTDAQGHTWFAQDPVKGGKQQFMPTSAEIAQYANSGGGLFHGRATWNPDTAQYEQNLDWGKILSMVAAGLMTAGVANALMGAPAGTAESMIGGGAGTNAGAGAAVVGTDSGLGAGSGVGVGSGVLGPSMESATDVYAAGGGNGLGSGSGLLSGTSGKVMKAIAALGAAAGGRALANQGGSGNVPPALQQLLQMSLNRSQYETPLFQAKTRGTYAMLPNFARDPNAQFPGGG